MAIVRTGNTFDLYRSNTGSSWTLMQTRTVTMGANVYIGMAVTGNSTTTLATGTFDNVTVTGGGGGGPTATPTPTSPGPTATPTNTPTPTATSPGPTATATPSPPPTATATNPPPTPTATPPPAEVVIQRVTFTLAGQAIAVKVSGDPTSDNNGIFYLFTDHLGSTVVLTKDSDGYILADSLTRYMPFGEYRGTAPSQAMTDQGYTGQKENMDIGLIYYNARFYLPGIARFASADTIVPNPANPQSFNRYTYTLNNPLKYTDPTGYCAEIGDDTCWTMYDRIVQICPECRTGAATLGTTLDQYGYNYQKEIFTRIQDGWRPSKPALTEQLDFITMSSNAIGLFEIAGDTSSIYINKLGGKFAGSVGDSLSKLSPFGPGLVAGQQLIENTNTEDSAFVEGGRVVWAVGKDAVTDSVAGTSAVLAASAVGSPAAGAVVFVACQFGCEFAAEYAIETVVTNIAEFTYPYVNPWNWYNSLVAQSGYNPCQP